jgi:hypothetical protein
MIIHKNLLFPISPTHHMIHSTRIPNPRFPHHRPTPPQISRGLTPQETKKTHPSGSTMKV